MDDLFVDMWISERFKIWFRAFADRICAFDIFSTVFFRNTGELQYDLMPFWSYRDYFNGVNRRLLADNIMNVVVFVPIGLLAGATFRSMSWKKVLVIGICLSVGIETLQFVFRKGFSEFDDVMHNTLGCLIGYGMYWIIRYGCNQYRDHQRAHSQQILKGEKEGS